MLLQFPRQVNSHHGLALVGPVQYSQQARIVSLPCHHHRCSARRGSFRLARSLAGAYDPHTFFTDYFLAFVVGVGEEERLATVLFRRFCPGIV